MIQICHDCNKEMELVQEEKIMGLDKQWSIIKFFVCWKCKRSRVERS